MAFLARPPSRAVGQIEGDDERVRSMVLELLAALRYYDRELDTVCKTAIGQRDGWAGHVEFALRLRPWRRCP